MTISWNKVTGLSQVVAIVLFVAIFFVGFLIGRKFENKSILGAPIASVKFTCADNKTIQASFYKNFVHIELGGKTLYLPQTISASGARYANTDESIVFWNKGNTAFVTENDPNNVTYKDCNEVNTEASQETPKESSIRVEFPQPNQTINSPLTIKGTARGSWFFEASFPVSLVDWDGLIIAQGTAKAKSDWMTTDLVPFEATLTFKLNKNTYSNKGALILRKDNPSGLPENNDSLEIPVVFADVQ